ncbi:hypothetical protein DEQ92_21745 [Haloferax sp. Atlit-6N]|uniref:hypothetical protein n=1 Tax=Haloferax sp. Atlit-6N TaxID=2077205 RepID=UPI000E24C56C|nr:hypothetical protein [Haloferax sp. Atlit-6N]RDZ95595.1 hypothetical protein DEQ92_21745 [Haloferax sp. Atlit-6N]
MKRLDRLFGLQIISIVAGFVGELLASEPLLTAAVGVFAVTVVATFAQMTGDLLWGLTQHRIPDTATDQRR